MANKKPSPPPPEGEKPSGRDYDELKEFIEDLEMILGDLIQSQRPIIPGRHHKRLQEAWEMSKVYCDYFKEELESRPRNVASAMQFAGLTGKQFRFKIGLFRQARDELLDLGLPSDAKTKKLAWLKRWFPRAKDFINSASVIVGSLARMIPGGEFLNEFLGSVCVAIDIGEKELDRSVE